MLVLQKHQKAARYSDYALLLSEDPKVSLNVGPVLSLQMGQDQKVVCNAENYYPLDVEIVWNIQDKGTSGQRVGAPLPEKLKNTLLSSHKHNTDKTYSISSFFYLTPSLKDEGKQFTCSVYHRSLRVPIKKSFILNVQGVLYCHELPHGRSRSHTNSNLCSCLFSFPRTKQLVFYHLLQSFDHTAAGCSLLYTTHPEPR